MTRIRNAALLLLCLWAIGLVGCHDSGAGAARRFFLGFPVDPTPFTVGGTNPIVAASGVPINQSLIAVFSEPIAPASSNTTTFTLRQGATPVSGTVTTVGRTSTFDPTNDLLPNTTYTAEITTGFTDLAGFPLTAKRVWTFTTGSAPDTTAPTAISTTPASAAVGVVLNGNLVATFSEAMNAATITGTTFTLLRGLTPVSGSVTALGSVATFDPTSDLLPSTLYTATISTEARDLAGNILAVVKVWTFTTGAAPDTTAPTVGSTNPANAAVGVSLNGNLAATFSEAMDPATITGSTYTLLQGLTPASGSVTSVGSVATFNPTSDLSPGSLYTARVSTGAKDLAGNALAADKVWTFTTGAAPDTIAPTVGSTNPADTATGVVINANVVATFSEAMDPATITGASFTLAQGLSPVAGNVSSVGTVATFNPTSDLASSTLYTARITTAVADLAGNTLVLSKVWTFTTGAAIAAGPAPVALGTAGNFAILTKSGISTVPTSAITGDIGVSPIDQTAITGFSQAMDPSNVFSTASQVTGRIYAADYAPPTPANMTTAIGDMEIAYTDAAGRTLPDFTELGAGEIGGLTLVPGLYKWGTGVSISTNVTLSGGANDVWIFQIAGGITQASATQVILTGGALPKNIFWQTFGAADIGTTAQFRGVLLSQTAVFVRTGASVHGRLLAQTAVTLDQNVVTQPAP